MLHTHVHDFENNTCPHDGDYNCVGGDNEFSNNSNINDAGHHNEFCNNSYYDRAGHDDDFYNNRNSNHARNVDGYNKLRTNDNNRIDGSSHFASLVMGRSFGAARPTLCRVDADVSRLRGPESEPDTE